MTGFGLEIGVQFSLCMQAVHYGTIPSSASGRFDSCVGALRIFPSISES